jgi:hypothetical protein
VVAMDRKGLLKSSALRLSPQQGRATGAGDLAAAAANDIAGSLPHEAAAAVFV